MSECLYVRPSNGLQPSAFDAPTMPLRMLAVGRGALSGRPRHCAHDRPGNLSPTVRAKIYQTGLHQPARASNSLSVTEQNDGIADAAKVALEAAAVV